MKGNFKYRKYSAAFFTVVCLLHTSWENGYAAVLEKEAPPEPVYLSTEEGGNTGFNTDYVVLFVDETDHEIKIFNSQRGSAAEGTVLDIRFPEQILGNDGHMWKATVKSPQEVMIYGAGTHKYYVEYQKGELVLQPETSDKRQEEKLEQWLDKAWKADCDITGEKTQNLLRPVLVLEHTEQNNSRIRSLVSMINDSDWHYFYLIGKNYQPQTLIIGSEFEAEYSSTAEDRFHVDGDTYTVIRVGVKRKWKSEQCEHDWLNYTAVKNTCLTGGSQMYVCRKCEKKEMIFLPAYGHQDYNYDSLCDQCGKRAFEQQAGSKIAAVLRTKQGEIPLKFTCLDENYKESGAMLYLADSTLDESVTGICFEDNSDYEDSPIRRYFQFVFSNELSIAPALLTIPGENQGSLSDYGAIFSKEEYEAYHALGLISEVEQGYLLRSPDGRERIWAVEPDGTISDIKLDETVSYGVRPFILLQRPSTEEKAEPKKWTKGEIQARDIGEKTFFFRCVDENYSAQQPEHQRTALFLCDSIIRSDFDKDEYHLEPFFFGKDNNYKTSMARRWLEEHTSDSGFHIEPAPIGVCKAFTGTTKRLAYGQLDINGLTGYDIGFQLITDRFFNLSVEEALNYKDVLWNFNGSEKQNPQTQISPYSEGYYLRTPFYTANGEGQFCYGNNIYIVDLAEGRIRTAKTECREIGLRPAFVLPQE